MAKSDYIQYRYREIQIDPFLMNNFSLEENLNFSGMTHSDELLDLWDSVMERIKFIIENSLTSRQKEVIQKIYFEQMTQTEVAAELGLCQPTVHKTLKGNIDYANNAKRYGGALQKIKKVCAKDTTVQELFKKIELLKSELIQY